MLLKPLEIVIANELGMIRPAQAAAGAYALLLGFPGEKRLRIELVMEEILARIVLHDFMPGQQETIRIVLEHMESGLRVRILSRSIPPDTAEIAALQNARAEDFLQQDRPGLGTYLVR
jgi:anti-sigma regulatory factor (Ser/Thr protein kinase)